MVWDMIKGAIFEDEPGSAPKAAAPAAAPVAQPAQAGSPVVYATPGVNMDMVTAIKKAIFSRPTPFTTLMAAADKLSSIIADSNLRLKAAFATASEGRTAKQVADAVDVHLVDVDG